MIENLVKVGALDAFGNRLEMLKKIPGLLEFKRRTSNNMLSIGPMGELEDLSLQITREAAGACLPEKEKLLDERELLSLDLSAHPLDFCILGDDFTRISNLPSLPTGQVVKIAGSVIRYQTPPTRTGKRVVYIILEDGSGVADVTVFSDVQERCGRVLFRCGWMEVRGKIQRRGPQSLSIIATEIRPLKSIAQI